MTTYDSVPYTSLAYPRTHPDHLSAMARLRGVAAASPETCALLELGCGSGGNVLPIAAHLERARVVGLERSAGEIGRAPLVPPNARLVVGDALAFDEGPFDYVIAHGLYSWIGEADQRALLATIRGVLAPQGVAFVSYNVLPGWHLRGAFRAMLRTHAQGKSPVDAIAASKQLLGFLDRTAPRTGAFRAALDEERARLASADDGYLFHEHLEEHNHPVSVDVFVAAAADAGLSYLCEADPLANPTEGTRRALAEIAGDDPIAIERAFDWARGRSFRCSLLVHEGVLRGARSPTGWFVESRGLTELDDDTFTDGDGRFSSSFADDLRRAIHASPDAAPIDALGDEHVALHEGGLIALRPRALGLDPRGAPTPLARATARTTARWVTNRRHEPVALEGAVRAALCADTPTAEARDLLFRLAFLG